MINVKSNNDFDAIMTWWDGGYNPEKYQINKAVKKEKKEMGKEVYGNWNPYGKLKPYIQLKVFLTLYFPILAYIIYAYYIEKWDNFGIIELVIFSSVISVPIYQIGAGLWLIQPAYSHPGWVDLECPECGHKGKRGQDAKGYAENFGKFLWNRVSLALCPKCGLDFEIENMSQLLWPYDDEPDDNKKYGDSSKIRIKPKIPFRFGSLILKKKKGFTSAHYELIKVGPMIGIFLGIPWYFGYLAHIFLLYLLITAYYIFIWKNWKFQSFREEIIKELENMGILRKNYVMRWWEELIINVIFFAIGIAVLFIFPEVFDISSN